VTSTATSSTSPAATAVEVRELAPGEEAAWDDYAAAHPRATFFHHHGWQDALRELSHRPVRLVAVRRGELRGVLPLCLARDHRGALGAWSLPHTVYGGPLADDDVAEAALGDAAHRFAVARGARRLELRNRYPSSLSLPAHPGYVTFERPLPPTPGELLATFNKGARAAVAQAARLGLEATTTGALDDFYPLLRASYRRLGTPVYPRRFLDAIRDRFADRVTVLIVRREGRALAGLYTLRFRDVMMPLFSGELAGARRLRAGNFMYHRVMEHAIALGVRRFDFGRSRLSHPGAVAFKRHLGGEEIPLPYQAWPDAPTGADPNRGGWPALRSLWRRLPAAVADRLGPVLVRRFP
jgi:FemAB-related protein (PEP-CTERM system-associated)